MSQLVFIFYEKQCSLVELSQVDVHNMSPGILAIINHKPELKPRGDSEVYYMNLTICS